VPTVALQPVLESYNSLAASIRDAVAHALKVPELTVLQQVASSFAYREATTSMRNTSEAYHPPIVWRILCGFTPPNIDNLRKLHVDQIEHLLSAQNQIVAALPKMIAAATDPELKRVLQTHLQETCEQVSRLEQITQQSPGKLEPKKPTTSSATQRMSRCGMRRS